MGGERLQGARGARMVLAWRVCALLLLISCHTQAAQQDDGSGEWRPSCVPRTHCYGAPGPFMNFCLPQVRCRCRRRRRCRRRHHPC